MRSVTVLHLCPHGCQGQRLTRAGRPSVEGRFRRQTGDSGVGYALTLTELVNPVRGRSVFKVLERITIVSVTAPAVLMIFQQSLWPLVWASIALIVTSTTFQCAILWAAIGYWRIVGQAANVRRIKVLVRYQVEFVNVAGWLLGLVAIAFYAWILSTGHDAPASAKNAMSLAAALVGLSIAVGGGSRKLLLAADERFRPQP